jgi:hypothetical protein
MRRQKRPERTDGPTPSAAKLPDSGGVELPTGGKRARGNLSGYSENQRRAIPSAGPASGFRSPTVSRTRTVAPIWQIRRVGTVPADHALSREGLDVSELVGQFGKII